MERKQKSKKARKKERRKEKKREKKKNPSIPSEERKNYMRHKSKFWEINQQNDKCAQANDHSFNSCIEFLVCAYNAGHSPYQEIQSLVDRT